MVTISIGGNGCGSVAGLTGNSGGSMITYRYDAYGNTTKSNNTLNNPYQYNAEYTDSSTGLQYLRARYYDSSQGRFTTKDTLLGSTDKPITRNLYTYCGNNPLNITDPSGHGWWSNAVNSVKRTANKVVNTVKRGYNTAKNWANTHIVQPVKSFISNTKQAASNAYNRGKSYVQQKYNQAKQTYNRVSNYVSNKAQQFYNDYVPPKMQKAIEEAKKFVCTTKDRIVKDTKEFIQNVDWKKVAIGVAVTAAITLAVVATGGAAAPVLIGAAVGAGASTGITVVTGVINGDSPADIAKAASDSFMWGAIGGAVGGGTAQIGTKALGKVGKKLVEDGVDMAVDLTQTATENGGLTGKDVLSSAVSSFGGDLLSSVKTNSSTKDLFALGLSDNKAVKDAVEDSLTDNKAVKNAVGDSVSKEKTYQTYTKTNPTTGEVYSGRTSGYGSPAENVRNRDRNHHMNDKGFGPAELDRSSNSYEAIRGREQDLIDYYGGAKSTGGTSGNAINGISDKNPNKNLYISSSRDEFGVLK